ncbi:MAG: TetR family transcriptional regulator [Moraxellaceae bacterium]|jgi:AcrR family transcriptional regulator|nr:TetR family transcriptional regulator [Moraxellaceae bacterium]
MARTKREQGREEKRDEIVAAARRLLVEDGYDATSMSRLATAAGVAPNTIYWYFRDKDEVLVAVLDAEFSARMADYLQIPATDRAERLLWVANQLREVSRLVGTVHSRLEKSPAINAWHERFHALSEAMLRAELQQAGMAPERIEAMVKISIFTIEGLLAHQLPEQEKRAICAALAAAS